MSVFDLLSSISWIEVVIFIVLSAVLFMFMFSDDYTYCKKIHKACAEPIWKSFWYMQFIPNKFIRPFESWCDVSTRTIPTIETILSLYEDNRDSLIIKHIPTLDDDTIEFTCRRLPSVSIRVSNKMVVNYRTEHVIPPRVLVGLLNMYEVERKKI